MAWPTRSCTGTCCWPPTVCVRRPREGKRPLPARLTDFQREIAARLVADLSARLQASNFSLGNARPILTRQQEWSWQRAVREPAGFGVLDPRRGNR